MIVIEGKGRDSDKRAEFIEAIISAVNEHCEYLSIVEVIGCLEIAKVMVLDGTADDED